MKLKTVRVRRSRPSTPALALALLITMLCVYLLSLSAQPETETRAAAAPAGAQLRMEGMEIRLACDGHCDDILEARLLAARCAESSGAGLVVPDGEQYAVVRGPQDGDPREDDIVLSAGGLTLNLHGPAGEIAAVSQAVDFLYVLARETGNLAPSLERGETDAGTLRTLMEIHRTRGLQALDALRAIDGPGPVPARLLSAVENALPRIDAAMQSPTPGTLRLIHTSACLDWIDTLNAFAAAA